jgi:hypothetical protein
MARMTMTARDGTVYGVYRSANGDYVAAEDDQGFHHAPAQYATLPDWSDAEARAALADAVSAHDEEEEEEYWGGTRCEEYDA